MQKKTTNRQLKNVIRPIVESILKEEAVDPKLWKTAKTEKICSDLANNAFKEIYKYTRQFGTDNSAYAQSFMIERLSEMIAEQI